MKATPQIGLSLIPKTKRVRAFTLIELLVVIATVAVLAMMILPALAKTKTADQRINCVYNLKQVGLAFRLWSQNHGSRYPMRVPAAEGGPPQELSMLTLVSGSVCPNTYQVFSVMSNELADPRITICPADADRISRTNFAISGTTAVATSSGGQDYINNSATSYFVGRDTDETIPQGFLAGDRNIGDAAVWSGTFPPGGVTGYSPNAGSPPSGYIQSLASVANSVNLKWTDKLHQARGNICLSDGSVQQYTSTRMRASITNAATAMMIMFP